MFHNSFQYIFQLGKFIFSPIQFQNEELSWVEYYSGKLSEDQIIVENSNNMYALPLEIETIRDKIIEFKRHQHYKRTGKKPNLYNGLIKRIAAIKISKNQLKLKIENTEYFNSYCTNYALDIYSNKLHSSFREHFTFFDFNIILNS